MNYLEQTAIGREVLAERRAHTAGYELGLKHGMRHLDIERVFAMVMLVFSLLTGIWLGRISL